MQKPTGLQTLSDPLDSLLTQEEFAKRLSVAVSVVRGWRKNGVHQYGRDYVYLRGGDGAPRKDGRHRRYKWPRAYASVLVVEAVMKEEEPAPATRPRRPRRSTRPDPNY
ncbi:MAG: hypothetical protein P1P84_19745 [Deferrisomatales bacterium]|nr:hypothetical protein [Deferrisomatales bacterium]